jgi:diguanylate cyclase (GGDEF)-like protein
MAGKASERRAKRDRPATDQPRRPSARGLARIDAADGAREAGNSDPVRLARHVARLEAELANMRARLRELETHAMLDPLTELLNRRGFAREIERAQAHVDRYGGRSVLACFDLDGFKAINDQYGHPAGDAVLRAVAAALRRNVRASDAVARLGGDEFAVLLWNLSDADAEAKAQALESAVALAATEWNGASISVRASAGTAPLAGTTGLAALAKADAAMYRRKRGKRGLDDRG